MKVLEKPNDKKNTKIQKFGLLFDTDGVILNSPHKKAWKMACIDWELSPNDTDFTKLYQMDVAGQPGITGAKNLLVKLKYFEKNQVTDINGISKAFRLVKQRYLESLIKKGEFSTYPDIGSIILDARLENVPMGVVSSSENAKYLLKNTKAKDVAENMVSLYPFIENGDSLLDLFDIDLLGTISNGIKTKEELYETAKNRLRTSSNNQSLDIFVFEDAESGIIAAKSQGLYTIGIARTNMTTIESMKKFGADLAYDETTLLEKGYEGIKRDILKIIGK
ncbi:hypothetical protein GOV12_02400 [Candidatus Pacearchaeota archaeon]|nr:hypothetical protein [Candidatus Pacearchaeota archaeon]